MAEGYFLTPAAAEQIVDTVIRVRGEPRTGKNSDSYPVSTWNPGVVDAIVTTAITAASGTTYGSGACQIYIDNNNGTAITDPAYPSPVSVLNWSQNTGTIAVNTHVEIGWRNGGWRLIVKDC